MKFFLMALAYGSAVISMEKSLPTIMTDEVQLVDKTTKQPIKTLKKSQLPFYDPILEHSPGSLELDLPEATRSLFFALLGLYNMKLKNHYPYYRGILSGSAATTQEALQTWKNLDFIGCEHGTMYAAIVDYIALHEGGRENVSAILQSGADQLLADVAKSYYLKTAHLPSSKFLRNYFEGVSINEAVRNKSLIKFTGDSIEIDCFLKTISGIDQLLDSNKKIERVKIKTRSLKNFDSDLIEKNKNQIKILCLDDNSWQKITLHHFSHLTALSLNFCRLKSLPDEMFKDCVRLKRLSLASNELRQLPTSLYQTPLEELNIQYNNFIEVPNFCPMQKLKRLYASNNKIKKVPHHSFNNTIARIDLTQNEIDARDIDSDFIAVLKTDKNDQHKLWIGIAGNPITKKEFEAVCNNIDGFTAKKYSFARATYRN